MTQNPVHSTWANNKDSADKKLEELMFLLLIKLWEGSYNLLPIILTQMCQKIKNIEIIDPYDIGKW